MWGNMNTFKKFALLSTCFAVSACNTLDRLEEVGKGPALNQQISPTQQANYKPVSNWPTPVEPAPIGKAPNSLWQPGARSFFKDQRATRVGDILTVNVQFSDAAAFDNTTSRSRTTSEGLNAPALLGLEKSVYRAIPGKQDPNNLLSVGGDSSSDGTGKISRKESVNVKVAASITQILPNGNMVVKGTQQVRVNYELREVTVEGVIRPEDISSDNTINSSQMAEARISYGGRGIVSDVQQPRYGNQIIDIISPF